MESVLNEPPFSFGEEMINQGIETIEFVLGNSFTIWKFNLLGSVSNTASYLRLWALSLAHNQLSKVFMEMILVPSISGDSNIIMKSIYVILSLPIFLSITFAVILVMDLMECFLHALRL